MKRVFALVLCLCLLGAYGSFAEQVPLPPERLIDLKHNAPNTGIMLPAAFNPYEETYLLTVASWVSRVTFTPTASPGAVVTVNGQPVASGTASPIIQMSDEPQEVLITVSVYGAGQQLSAQTTYTVYLQRRPSERRTRVSAGFISEITLKDAVATISADLVTIKYQDGSNISSFINDTVYMYKYDCAPNCLFYYGTLANPIRAKSAQEFINLYLSTGNNLYYLIYIEDKIVAVMPYAAG
ncbi:MAG: cadherin-like beta sandwich domain-containing protein [Christensenellales bacterium]